MKPFSVIENRIWISATLEMQTALAVGSRLSIEPTGTDMPVIKDTNGRPFIPGSSLKGVFRFHTERLLRTIDRKPDLWACDPFGDPCVRPADKDSLMSQAERQAKHESQSVDAIFAKMVFQHSCAACRLFGSPWFASRIAFKDAYLKNHEDLPVLYQIRDGVGIDRDLGAARSGIKYDFETVVPGAQFAIEIVGENLEDWEIGLLLTVLQLWSDGGIAIGGKSTRGPGWGTLREIALRRVDRTNLLDYLRQRSAPPVSDWETFRNAFAAKLQEVGHA
ncbi:MAG: CRISPR-associated RAMP protein Csx7 [Anaerolineae bacterium]|nr:CRISPR-associated RAMP protein Csx7 [Anaerolineae bacterium]